MKPLAVLVAVGAIAGCACGPFVSSVHAQATAAAGSEANEYARAISGAVSHFEAGRFQDALAGFNQAHALQPSARTWRGIGLASYSLQDFARARRAFERALIDPRRPLAEAQRAEVEGLLRETTRHTGRFELHVEPSDARVEVDGVATVERELVLAVGDHTLLVSAPGHTPHQRTLQVQGEEVSALPITLAPIVTAPSTAATTSQPTRRTPTPVRTPTTRIDDTSPADDGRNAVPWIVLGSAPVFAVASAVVWWSGLAERNAIERQCAVDLCTRDESDRRVDAAHLSSYETATNVLLGAAIVTAVGGATWLLITSTEESQSNRFTLRAGPTGLQLDGQF